MMLLVVITVFITFVLVLKLFFGRRLKDELVVTIFGTSAALCLAEIVLVFSGFGATYLEKRGNGRPVDVNYQKEQPWTWDTNGQHRLKTSVFDYPRSTNRFGLSDYEWEDSTSSYRILVLGDSFTEGDGAPYDSSWVSLIRSLFKHDSIPVKIMNAGVCGSDPYEQLNLYNKVLAPLKPNLIIVATSTPDYTWDGMQKGGIERFNRHGHNISLLEASYAYSRVARLFLSVFFGYDEILVSRRDTEVLESKSKFLAQDIVTRFSNAVAVPVLFVMFPYESETSSGKYAYSIDDVISNACRQYENTVFFSTMACYTEQITKLKLRSEDLWWIPEDGHHKPQGYAMMAECIYKKIKGNVQQEVSKYKAKRIKH